MTEPKNNSLSIGDLVVAVYDQAATSTTDPVEVSRLANVLLLRVLKHVHRPERRRRASAVRLRAAN
jgi:hypothetical protein